MTICTVKEEADAALYLFRDFVWGARFVGGILDLTVLLPLNMCMAFAMSTWPDQKPVKE